MSKGGVRIGEGAIRDPGVQGGPEVSAIVPIPVHRKGPRPRRPLGSLPELPALTNAYSQLAFVLRAGRHLPIAVAGGVATGKSWALIG